MSIKPRPLRDDSMAVNDHVRSRIRELRIAKRLRVSDVARRSGIPSGSYSCLEAGHFRINLDNLYRILFALRSDITGVWPADRTLKGTSQDSPNKAGQAAQRRKEKRRAS